jgi:hypothetical protein
VLFERVIRAYEETFGYDLASRLKTVSSGTYSATYSYVANSPLVGNITFAQSGTTRMTTTKQYDSLNRLTLNQSALPSGTVVASSDYEYIERVGPTIVLFERVIRAYEESFGYDFVSKGYRGQT